MNNTTNRRRIVTATGIVLAVAWAMVLGIGIAWGQMVARTGHGTGNLYGIVTAVMVIIGLIVGLIVVGVGAIVLAVTRDKS
jgi:hypothetical protein